MASVRLAKQEALEALEAEVAGLTPGGLGAATPAQVASAQSAAISAAAAALAAAQAENSAKYLPWRPNTAYTAGTFVSNAGLLYTVNANFTSPGTFSTTGLTSLDAKFQPSLNDAVWIPARAFDVAFGSPTYTGGAPRAGAWLMDAAAQEAVGSSITIPAWWVTFAVDFYWYNAGAGTGNVIWLLYRSQPVEGDTLNGFAASDQTYPTAARAQDVLDVVTVVSGLSNTGAMMTLIADRYSADADDTLGNDAGFIGMKLRRTS